TGSKTRQSDTFVYPISAHRTDYVVNDDAFDHWDEYGDIYPLIPNDSSTIASSIELLFTNYKSLNLPDTSSSAYVRDDDPRNQVGCEAAATLVQLGSLAVATNPSTLWTTLGEIDSRYVAIDDPLAPSVLDASAQPEPAMAVHIAEAATSGTDRVVAFH